MINKEIKEGSYVYIPSSSVLIIQENNKYIKKTKTLQEPVYVLYLGESKQNCFYGQVFYEGKVWSTHTRNIYPGKKNE